VEDAEKGRSQYGVIFFIMLGGWRLQEGMQGHTAVSKVGVTILWIGGYNVKEWRPYCDGVEATIFWSAGHNMMKWRRRCGGEATTAVLFPRRTCYLLGEGAFENNSHLH
jgi:hypothetical protein